MNNVLSRENAILGMRTVSTAPASRALLDLHGKVLIFFLTARMLCNRQAYNKEEVPQRHLVKWTAEKSLHLLLKLSLSCSDVQMYTP